MSKIKVSVKANVPEILLLNKSFCNIDSYLHLSNIRYNSLNEVKFTFLEEGSTGKVDCKKLKLDIYKKRLPDYIVANLFDENDYNLIAYDRVIIDSDYSFTCELECITNVGKPHIGTMRKVYLPVILNEEAS